jgi:GNAT superfamily N-acetyltransferase
LRRAGADDAGAVAEVWLRSRRASIPAIPAPVHDDDEVRAYFESVVLPGLPTWVIERDAYVVAILVLRDRWIEHLYVDPEWTGQGLGSELLGRAKQVHPDGLDLWTFESNTDARRFYERHGFIAVGSTDGDNEEGAPDVHYRWSGSESR